MKVLRRFFKTQPLKRRFSKFFKDATFGKKVFQKKIEGRHLRVDRWFVNDGSPTFTVFISMLLLNPIPLLFLLMLLFLFFLLILLLLLILFMLLLFLFLLLFLLNLLLDLLILLLHDPQGLSSVSEQAL